MTMVNAVVYFKVWDSKKSIIEVENFILFKSKGD